MNNLDRVEFICGRPCIPYTIKSGAKKGKIMRAYGKMITCRECGKEAFVSDRQRSRGKESVCSHKCQKLRDHCERWKGGVRLGAKGGYVRIMVGKIYPGCDDHGYVYQHRYIIENYLKRSLVPGEVVHHIDRDTSNNRLENLIVMSSADHVRMHHKEKAVSCK